MCSIVVWQMYATITNASLLSYLSCGLHSFPHTKVTDDPGQQETQSQFPLHIAHLVDISCQLQNSPPASHIFLDTIQLRCTQEFSDIAGVHLVFGHFPTHSQNSLTGDVAFSPMVQLI